MKKLISLFTVLLFIYPAVCGSPRTPMQTKQNPLIQKQQHQKLFLKHRPAP